MTQRPGAIATETLAPASSWSTRAHASPHARLTSSPHVAAPRAKVVPAIALHAAANAVPFILPESLVAIRGFNTVSEDVYHLPLPLLLASSAITAAALFVLARAKKTASVS